jgi:hypothetical protein
MAETVIKDNVIPIAKVCGGKMAKVCKDNGIQ